MSATVLLSEDEEVGTVLAGVVAVDFDDVSCEDTCTVSEEGEFVLVAVKCSL